ncbi:MAG: cyclase family protein [Bacillota bacterium]
MKKLIDLSQTITNSMPVYPGDLEVELKETKNLTKDGYCSHSLKISMHTGTHLDLPAHMVADQKEIADIDLSLLSGKAKIFKTEAENIIGLKERYKSQIEKDDIVIFNTGFAQNYNKENYYQNYPVISEELADLLIAKEIKILGFDIPSPDYSPFKIHKKLFKNDIFILENLCNLDQLADYDAFRILIFPLKIKAEAALCRVAAEI